MNDMHSFEQQLASGLDQLAGPRRPVDAMAISRDVIATQSPKWRFQSMFSATKFVVAGAIVALFGGFLLSGVLTQPSDEMAPAAATATASGSPTPVATFLLEQSQGVVWDSGSARLEADHLELHVGNTVFTGNSEATVIPDSGSSTATSLQVGWMEQGVQQLINIYFEADEQDWWVRGLRTLDDSGEGEWIHYAVVGEPVDGMLRTPRGEAFEGDVLLSSVGTVPAVLEIEGLRLSAFVPGTGPGLLVGCDLATAEQLARGGPLARKNPLRGSGIETMSPAEAESLLRDLGLCFTFRYEYPVGMGGYSERWCTAPPGGKITDAFYLDDGEIVVTVEDDRERSEREQPQGGWNCPTN